MSDTDSTPTTGEVAPSRYEESGSARSATASNKVVAGGLALLAVSLVGIGGYVGYKYLTGESVESSLTNFTIVNESTISAQLDVTRSDPSVPVVCVIQGFETSGAEVGRREVYVPPADKKSVRFDTTLTVSAPASGADVYGCTESIPSYLDTSSS